MTQPIRLKSLVAAPAADFEQPFEMLEACHERVQRMLTLLVRLREHLPQHGCDLQAQQAARDILRYFDQAAPQHHRDEELHVFPPLLSLRDPRIAGVVLRLQEDHLRMESCWQDARCVLARIAGGQLQALGPEDDRALDAFSGLYDEHVRVEEEIAYPAAQELLDERALQEIGREMMQRRGVK